MEQFKNNFCFLALISFLHLIGCNEPASTPAKSDRDTSSALSKSDTCGMPPYDPAIDAAIVGAAFAKKFYDTLNMKMYEFTLKPDDSLPLHNHPDHAIYVLQGGKVEVTVQGEAPGIFEPKTGDGWITGPYTDKVKNIGNTTVKWIEISVLRPRCK